MRTQFGVQFVEHNARLDAHPALGDVQLEDAVQVFRRVGDQARSDGLSSLGRAAAAHGQGATVFRADSHQPDQGVA